MVSKRRPQRAIRALTVHLGLLGGSLVVSAVLAEALARTVAGIVRPRSAGFRANVITEYDSLLGWRIRPNVVALRRTREYRHEFQFDDRGRRGGPFSIPKPVGRSRILLMGESFTEGYSVADADVVSTVVGKRLEGTPWAPFDVVNAGVRGYSTDQQVIQFEHRLREYSADVVVLLFYINDIWFNNSPWYWRGAKPRFVQDGRSRLTLTNVPVPTGEAALGLRPAPVPGQRFFRWLNDHTELHRMWTRASERSHALAHLRARFGYVPVPPEVRPYQRTPGDTLAAAWHMTGLLLDRLRTSVAETGARFVVFHVPTVEAVHPEDWRRFKFRYAISEREWHPEQEGRTLETICVARSIDCIVPFSEFRRVADSLAVEGERLYYRYDRHWNANGHRLAAEIIARRLIEVGPRR